MQPKVSRRKKFWEYTSRAERKREGDNGRRKKGLFPLSKRRDLRPPIKKYPTRSLKSKEKGKVNVRPPVERMHLCSPYAKKNRITPLSGERETSWEPTPKKKRSSVSTSLREREKGGSAPSSIITKKKIPDPLTHRIRGGAATSRSFHL